MMPELPEVQTVLATLLPRLLGLRIERVEVLLEKIIRSPDPQQFAAQVCGRTVTGLKRLGKYLVLELDGGLLLVVHLRMTGRLIYANAGAPTVAPNGAPTGMPTEAPNGALRGKHTHLVFYLSDGAELRFQDLRQFGTMDLMPVDRWMEFCSQKNLGPDALDASLSCDLFQERLARRKGPIKKLLLDQALVAGIGNIYANEILWEAGVHPERMAGSLTRQEVRRIHQMMGAVLKEAIAHRGTTLRDYVDGEGNPGGFQEKLAVHGREGRPCPRCGTAIIRLKTGGRSSFICSCCQTL